VRTAATSLSFLVSTLQRAPLCQQVRILEVNTFSARQFALKVRAEFANGQILQIRLYCNQNHTDYAYQIMQDGRPWQRWDNKEHFPNLPSYPHHCHLPDGRVVESPLTGQPEQDLLMVLSLLGF
jgi:hypothetical protein